MARSQGKRFITRIGSSLRWFRSYASSDRGMLANAFFDIRTRTESARRRRAALVAILAIGVAIQIYRLLSPPAVPPNKPLDARARRFLEDVTRDPRPQGGSPKRR